MKSTVTQTENLQHPPCMRACLHVFVAAVEAKTNEVPKMDLKLKVKKKNEEGEAACCDQSAVHHENIIEEEHDKEHGRDFDVR